MRGGAPRAALPRTAAQVPAISVLLPAYQAEATLATALHSVRRQSEQDWECVIVDDGSRDRSPEIAEAFVRTDPRFQLLRLSHVGIVRALQAGVEACSGELVARMDADDIMHRHRLRLQRAALAEASLAGVGCHVRLFPRGARLTDGLRAYERWLCAVMSSEDIAREAFVECPLAHPTWMMRRSIMVELGYRDADWPEDYDLLLRLLANGGRLGTVPKRLLLWRDGPRRLSRRSARYSLASFVACKAEHLSRSFLANTERYVLWGYGDTGKALAQALAQRGKHPSSIIELHPGRLEQLIRGVRVVRPEALLERRGEPIVVSVAGARPRSEIRAALTAMGFVELRDYVCAA